MADTKIRNPFIHSHDHDHDHGHHHDHDHFEPTDPAQQSLADALRVSFTVLKWAMVVLLVIYLFTGIFRVEEQQRAVRLQFGKMTGDPMVYEPGWYFGLPYPIEQKIFVPVAPRTISLANQYWFESRGSGQTLDEQAAGAGPLNPERDGSLLTGDANIVHGRFEVTYVITDPAAYVSNVGNLAKADVLVRSVAEQGVVFAIAQSEADAVIRNQFSRLAAVSRMQEVLDAMQTGITIREQNFALTDRTMPLPVRAAYQAVINAESERGRLVEVARQQRTSILNAAAGEAHDQLFNLVLAYEMAAAAGQDEQAEALSQAIDEAFDSLSVETEAGAILPIGGEAATIINQAHTYSTQTVQQIKTERNTFESLLEQYRQSPELVRSQLWETTRQAIFTGEVETIYAPTQDRLNVLINSDPRIQREREQQRLQQEQEAARQGR